LYFQEEEDRKVAAALEGTEEREREQARGGRAAVLKPDKVEDMQAEAFSFPDDPGSNNCGMYELQGVLTHRGRSSSSGHYVAWVRGEGDTWFKCDDDVVSPVTDKDVLKLSGGGMFFK
jgi:ubiquitin carboxyl-terminal hydrolase 14